MAGHRHARVDAIAGCDDCGEHQAVRCADPECDMNEPIDLVYHDDPRDQDQDEMNSFTDRDALMERLR